MWTQRISVINDQDDHLGVLQDVTPDSVVILPSSENFLVEYKLRLLTTPNWSHTYPLIAELRIQCRTTQSSFAPVFDYGFSQGSSVYVKPQSMLSNDTRQQFYDQARSLLEDLIGISVSSDAWVYTTGALYYHTSSSIALNISAIGHGPAPLLVEQVPMYDMFYDTKTLTVKQVQPLPQKPLTITRQDYKIELGVFLIDKEVTSRDDILLDGLRVVLDKSSDDESFAFETMIHIKPRNRYLSTVHNEIIGSGIHPILRTVFNDNYAPPLTDDDIEECELYYYINLDKSLIFDQYQSVPSNFDLVLTRGNNDLELPAYKINSWGSEVLFQHTNATDFDGSPIDFMVHSRYQLPHQNESHTLVNNVHPQIFWGCRARDPQYLSASPFDSKQTIGGNYDMFFTNDTVYYHFGQHDMSLLEVAIPHALSSPKRINILTSSCVLLGVAYVLYHLGRAIFGKNAVNSKNDIKRKAEKEKMQ